MTGSKPVTKVRLPVTKVRCENCGAIKIGSQILTACCGGYRGKNNFYHRQPNSKTPDKVEKLKETETKT